MGLSEEKYTTLRIMTEAFIRYDVDSGRKISYKSLGGYIDRASKTLSIVLDLETFNNLLTDMEV